MEQKNNLVLVDGNNVCWRAFKRANLSYSGDGVELVYLGLKMLFSYLDLVGQNGRIVVVWDGGRDRRRTEKFPDYKKKKEMTEQERREYECFKRQRAVLKNILSSIGIPQIQVIGREADDVMASISNVKKLNLPILLRNIGKSGESWLLKVRSEQFSGKIYIVSTDQDYVQLLTDERVIWYNPAKFEGIGKDSCYAKYGFYPNEYVIYKALVGNHDNIPGVRGVGPRYAVMYIESLRAERENPVHVPCGSKRIMEMVAGVDLTPWIELCKFLPVPESEISGGFLDAYLFGNNCIEYGRALSDVFSMFKFDSLLKRASEIAVKLFPIVS